MARSVDQVFRMQVAPLPLRREIGVVAQVLPRIRASVDEQEPVRSEVEISVDVPPVEIGRRGDGVVSP